MFNFRCIRKLLQYLKFGVFLLIENIFCIFSLRKKYFAGEIVLITGSANGIGRQVALKLAPLGVTLVLWDIDDEGNKETSRLAQQNGANRVFVYHCDCSSREDVYEQADKETKETIEVSKEEVLEQTGQVNKRFSGTRGVHLGILKEIRHGSGGLEMQNVSFSITDDQGTKHSKYASLKGHLRGHKHTMNLSYRKLAEIMLTEELTDLKNT